VRGPKPVSHAYIGLGGNLGDPARSMREALHWLAEAPTTRIVKVSSLYRTPPWGKTDQPDFLNAAVEIATGLSPRAVLRLCLDTERRLKRVRAERWGPRLIDLDLLVHGDAAIDEPDLALPHPRMLERGFVLVPLAEIAPDLVVAGETIAAHLARLGSDGIVKAAGPDWWQG
jgi:2-amino-4-hydroxy-6-hydroxymethyldihydropteridine diphosphokinase